MSGHSWREASRRLIREEERDADLTELRAALDKALSGTFNDCHINGIHEHAFRGPHYFREWNPADYPQYGRLSAGDKAEAPSHD